MLSTLLHRTFLYNCSHTGQLCPYWPTKQEMQNFKGALFEYTKQEQTDRLVNQVRLRGRRTGW